MAAKLVCQAASFPIDGKTCRQISIRNICHLDNEDSTFLKAHAHLCEALPLDAEGNLSASSLGIAFVCKCPQIKIEICPASSFGLTTTLV